MNTLNIMLTKITVKPKVKNELLKLNFFKRRFWRLKFQLLNGAMSGLVFLWGIQILIFSLWPNNCSAEFPAPIIDIRRGFCATGKFWFVGAIVFFRRGFLNSGATTKETHSVNGNIDAKTVSVIFDYYFFFFLLQFNEKRND